MTDDDVVARISQLATEEHELERSHAGGPVTSEDTARLRALEVALDQCWDLLRQRRARRNAGLNPNEAVPRGEGTVEGYQQ